MNTTALEILRNKNTDSDNILSVSDICTLGLIS